MTFRVPFMIKKRMKEDDVIALRRQYADQLKRIAFFGVAIRFDLKQSFPKEADSVQRKSCYGHILKI